MELITTMKKREVIEHHTAFFIPSIATVLMIDFDSRRLLQAYAVDILNECETGGSMRRYEEKPRN
jgi:hypothetical protein